MLIKIKIEEIIKETEFAKNIVIGEFDYWIPKSLIIKEKDNIIITYKWWARNKNLDDYIDIELEEGINKDLPPLKELINEKRSDYFPKKAMKHQEDCFKWAIDKKCVALFNEMGTGKSKLYIDISNYHYSCDNIDKVIYFAPPTTLDNFKNELKLWQSSNLNWEILSIHVLSLKSADDIIEKYNINNKTMIIIDESHRIKNIDSNMGNRAFILGTKTDFKIIGTGTSAPNNPLDLIGQFRFLTPQYYNMSKNHLKKAYLRVGDKGIIFGVKDPLEILNQSNPYTYSIQKKDCLDLPDKVFYKKYANNNKLKDFIDEINKVNNTQFLDEKGSLMGYLQNLRKLATGRDLDGNIVIENPKIQILKELLEDIPDNQKVIIWHNLYIELEDILKAIKDNFVLLNGEQNNKEKAEAIYNFKHGDKKYLIATQSTGGVGLNFTEATINIYFSNSFNLIDRLQSESRSHRIGQQEQLIIYDIINLGSIDTKILKSLERKEDFLQQLQDLYKQKKEEVIKNLEDK